VSTRFFFGMVSITVSLLCAAPVYAAVPKKKVVIGISKIVSHPALDAVVKGIQDELSVAEINATFDVQNANGDISTAASIANKFQADKVTLAVGVATPTAQALVNTLKGIPIVFTAVTDPVRAGLVASLGKGETNVTGVSDMVPVKQQIELLMKIKKVKRLGQIYTSSEQNAVVLAGIVKQVCRELKVEYVESTVTSSSEVKQAAQEIIHRVDALYISTDNTVVSAMSTIAEVAMQNKVPIMSADPRSSAAHAVLTAWGGDYYKIGRATGKMIVEILNGKQPGQIPIRIMTEASDADLMFNLEVANKLGLSVSNDLLRSAGKVIGEADDTSIASGSGALGEPVPENRIEERDSVPGKIEAPLITILSPEVTRGVKITLNNSSLTVVGKATSAQGVAIVTINGQQAAMDAAGNFSAEVLLRVGETRVTVVATDINRATTSEIFTIARAPGQVAKLKEVPERVVSTDNGKYFALIIGVKEYGSSDIPSLDHPLDDAQMISDLITSAYMFDPENVILLKNPDQERVIDALDNLSNRVGNNDSLLIFYAGHGYWDEKMKQGFWLPSDARMKSRVKWLSNSTVRDYINGIKSRHTLLIADACFSGGIFKTRSVDTGAIRAAQELQKFPSRKAMTSGALKEVPDHSVFVEYLVKRLKENRERFVSSEQLFSSMRQAVINNSPNAQVPQFGEIRETGDEGGDFVFVRRQR